MSDEIITEVHAIKDALSEKFKGNVHELFEEIKKGEDELRASGFHFISPPDSPANLPSTAFQRNRFTHRSI